MSSKTQEENFTDFILTRYLYVFDEVGLTFVESLLTHKSLEETIFWISELYHSGYTQKSWELLWFVYFDFYFVSYPGFIKYLSQKHKAYTFQSLLGVAHNLHAFKRITPFVFLLRLLSCNRFSMKDPIKPTVYKGRKPAWLIEHFPDESFHPFIRDLYSHRYESIACHSLPAIDGWNYDSESESEQVALRFLSTIQTYYQVESTVMDSLSGMLHFCLSDETEIDKNKYKNNNEKGDDDKEANEHDVNIVQESTYRPYKNYRHVLLAIVCLFEFSISPSGNSTVNIPELKSIEYVPGSNSKDINYTQFLDKEYKIPTSPWSPKYAQKYYKCHSYMKWTEDTFKRKTIYLGIPITLLEMFEMDNPIEASSGRLPSYATSENIIPFILSRESYNYDIVDLWKDKWLYFASKSPLWYTRLSNYNFRISHDDYSLELLSDEDIDSFHSAFPYDPEQETCDNIDKAIPRLFQEYQLIDWLNIVFPDNVLEEHCCGNSRFALYLKYHTHTLLQHEHVCF